MRRTFARAALLAGAVALLATTTGVVTAAPGHSFTSTRTTTGSCTDGGGVRWHTKVVWGATYVLNGVRKVSVDYAGWTSPLGSVATDSSVRSYSGAALVQDLTRTATVDYRQGTTSVVRNPANPRSGAARIVISLGRDGDGAGSCSVTHSESTARTDPVVATVGDMVCPSGTPVTPTSCQQKAVSDSILAAAPNVFIPLGDNQYQEGALAQYRAAYEPSFGRLKSVTSPVPGNHEYQTADAAGYFTYFGTAAGVPSKGYYSFDVGAWHVIALNSEKDLAATGAQVAWLEQDLAAHPNTCTMAVLHKPRFSSGSHGSNAAMKPFVDALVAARAELVLSGHDHDYERFAPQDGSGRATSAGVVQVVSGMGGRSLYDYPVLAPNSVSRHNDGFGWVQLTLHPTSADLRYVGVGTNTYTETTNIACR
jgi:hypothetical protein